MNEVNCHARLSDSKHMLEKHSCSDGSIILLTDKKYLHWLYLKNNRIHDWLDASAATKKKDTAAKPLHARLTFNISRWVSSSWQSTN